MVIQNVRLRRLKFQKGISLIELMIASAIGIIALMAVGSVFLSGQKLALERSQKLLVLQSINEALRYIKEDSQRAGFNGVEGQSLMLSGASSVIQTTSASVAYTYKAPDNTYTQTSFLYEDSKLKVCENSNEASPITTVCIPTLSLLDYDRINVDGFHVSGAGLGSTVSSAFITITLTASLLDGSHQQTMSTQIKQRNWQ
ncbi:PilW family protein [Vibrio rumoiensis]|uniref:Pilus assembly protein PilW n=1 Tax=Vibrio rumoiensis 1S-45 TaxID=1188252 RepID=A0A1E5E584_9VIBR|nr:prepilin-type N-terminal cleavage/methylation domain-containing protein [Vibrio rumoiensis]OEF28581.1 hypothetical protein A1QC_04745 [Vibrio rumoiensis 1S-45]